MSVQDIKIVLKGIVLGISNIIPGVSAGTMAVVMGIYNKIISSVSQIFKNFKENFRFLLFLGLGLVLGVILFSKIISYFLFKHPWEMNYLFIGLIAGTLGVLFNTIKSYKPKKVHYIYFVVAFLFLILSEFLNVFTFNTNVIEGISFYNIILLFVSGFLAASAMILPGISGSFILVLIGVYNPIIIAVSELNILVLIPFGIGVVAGFLCMVKIVEYLLKRFTTQTYMAIFGLVTGSLVSLFPGFEFSLRQVVCVLMLFIGFGISYYIGKLNKEK